MGKRIRAVGSTLLALILALGLAACGSQQEDPVSQESSISVSSAQEESSQPALEPEPREAEEPSQSQAEASLSSQEPEESALVLVQEDSGAEPGAEPTVTLYPDGTFALTAFFYDGTASITGTYVQQGEGYVLTPLESTAQGTEGSDVGEIILTPQDGGFAYGGEQLGVTYDGAVFQPSQQ